MISSLKKLKINSLIEAIDTIVNKKKNNYKMTLYYADIKTINEIYQRGTIINKKAGYNSITFEFCASKEDYLIIENIRKSSFSEDL